MSPLAQFLIDRACKSLELANFFYWYLRVDLEDATHGHVFRGVQAAFLRAMLQNPESARVMGERSRAGGRGMVFRGGEFCSSFVSWCDINCLALHLGFILAIVMALRSPRRRGLGSGSICLYYVY